MLNTLVKVAIVIGLIGLCLYGVKYCKEDMDRVKENAEEISKEDPATAPKAEENLQSQPE